MNDDIVYYQVMSDPINASEIIEFRNEMVFWGSRVAEIVKYYHNVLDSEQIKELIDLINSINRTKKSLNSDPETTPSNNIRSQLSRTLSFSGSFDALLKKRSSQNPSHPAPSYPAPQIELTKDVQLNDKITKEPSKSKLTKSKSVVIDELSPIVNKTKDKTTNNKTANNNKTTNNKTTTNNNKTTKNSKTNKKLKNKSVKKETKYDESDHDQSNQSGSNETTKVEDNKLDHHNVDQQNVGQGMSTNDQVQLGLALIKAVKYIEDKPRRKVYKKSKSTRSIRTSPSYVQDIHVGSRRHHHAKKFEKTAEFPTVLKEDVARMRELAIQQQETINRLQILTK